MFQSGLQERIQLMEPALVERSDKCLYLTEKGEGKAELEVRLRNDCILIRNLENNKLEYFKNKKCADYVMFESKDDIWKVHIFEMKRTVKEETWERDQEAVLWSDAKCSCVFRCFGDRDSRYCIAHSI